MRFIFSLDPLQQIYFQRTTTFLKFPIIFSTSLLTLEITEREPPHEKTCLQYLQHGKTIKLLIEKVENLLLFTRQPKTKTHPLIKLSMSRLMICSSVTLLLYRISHADAYLLNLAINISTCRQVCFLFLEPFQRLSSSSQI